MTDIVTPVQRPSSESNSPLNFSHPDDHFQSRYVTPGFKPSSYVHTKQLKVNRWGDRLT